MEQHAALAWPLTIAHVGSTSLETSASLSIPQWLLPVRVVRIARHRPAIEQADRLIAANCQVVSGHPTALEAVSEVLIRRHQKHRTKLIASRGEILSDRLRSVISRAFNGRIADYYNCEEVGNVAYECPADPTKMHVNTSACLLEVVNENGQPQVVGVEGEIVITNLYNHTMPFIRYRLGDRATLLSHGGRQCACGSLRPTISPPAGRSDDYFRFPDGRQLSPRAVEGLVILPLLKRLRVDSPDVLRSPRYQIIQESMKSVRLLVDSQLGFTDELVDEVEASFSDMGFVVSLIVSETANIPVEDSGKRKTVVSHVS
jgi:phenylacetate-CoA ligase